VSQTELEILIASQNEAAKLLADARAEAEKLLTDASDAAAELLRTQHDEAERLLLEEEEIARRALDTAVGESEKKPNGESRLFLDEHNRRAVEILESQRHVAEALESAEADTASEAKVAVRARSADILMEAQREASAALLRGWMRVTELRGGETR
jgi:ABC-type transporter Mla subunit MlaD